jgi:hypothetical protein
MIKFLSCYDNIIVYYSIKATRKTKEEENICKLSMTLVFYLMDLYN